MKNYILSLKLFVIAIFLCSITNKADAQLYEIFEYIDRAATARQQISELKEGTLVVRLPSKRNNIKALEKSLASGNLNPSQRSRLERRLKNTIIERDKTSTGIIKGLAQHYNFSKYRVVYDHDISQLFDNVEKGYFLDQKMKIDPSISIDLSKPFYVLGNGFTSRTTNIGSEGYIFFDQENKQLYGPFPYFYGPKYPAGSSLIAFFGGGDTLVPNYSSMVKKIDKSLNRFYARAQIRAEKLKLKKQLKDLKDGN